MQFIMSLKLIFIEIIKGVLAQDSYATFTFAGHFKLIRFKCIRVKSSARSDVAPQ